jgi:hypothetical protein
VELRDI